MLSLENLRITELLYSYTQGLSMDIDHPKIEAIVGNHNLLIAKASEAGCPVKEWESRWQEILREFQTIRTETTQAMEAQIVAAITQPDGLLPFITVKDAWNKSVASSMEEFQKEMRR